MTETNRPRIYVACLAAYNAGKLHGEWIDATQDIEDLRAEIEAMLKASPEPHAEEYALHDFENFGSLRLSEYENLDHVAEVAQLISLHGELAWLVIDDYGGLAHLDEARAAIEDRFVGCFEDREEWIHDLLEQTQEMSKVPEYLRPYFDLDRYAHDLELSGEFTVLEGRGGKVYVLLNR
jgi:antirestriction protein